MDVVYLFKEDTENNSEELRYSLRSLRNVKHKNIFIVGENPSWTTGVIHVPIPQNSTKHENVSRNLKAAIHNENISDEFILMNDDFFIMKPIKSIPNINFGSMREVIQSYKNRYPDTTPYIERMESLYKELRSSGYADPISYELHTPMVINRHIAMELYRMRKNKRLYQFRTFYGNFAQLGGKSVKDVKIFLPAQHNDPDFNEHPTFYLNSQVFLSATGTAFKQGVVGEFVRNAFPDKSDYELS